VSKTFYKKSTKKSQTDFFSIFFYHVFGRFSVRGVQKHEKKISKKSDQPRYFFGLRGTNQPRRGPSLFFFSAPCGRPTTQWPSGSPLATRLSPPVCVCRLPSAIYDTMAHGARMADKGHRLCDIYGAKAKGPWPCLAGKAGKKTNRPPWPVVTGTQT
jgi:hypothetical protein